ncbi:hypothetical protein [Pleionea litopenaei]|uniref:Uncharacterized protein n=1 Tax=Pleionea litopenaei TaxID=3070815 RepID=A0AA51RTH5_9GAMM|nr:hypothetical protein [Pleionea sp. HL-JVS1]WMS87396.1 hypothetical protein Q9312_00355 [Pleionea sp. HL-JVS1]
MSVCLAVKEKKKKDLVKKIIRPSHSKAKKQERSKMEQLEINNGYTHTLYLDASDYIPREFVKTELPWSVALNILCSLKLDDYIDGNIALFMEYEDLRGKHRLPVDFQQLEFESSVLFSNLVHLPARGNIADLCLKVIGVPQGINVEVEVMHIQLEESRSFIDSQPARKVI